MSSKSAPFSGDDAQIDDVVDHLARALQPIVAALQERTVGVGDWIEAIKIASYRAAHEATNHEAGRAVFARMSIRTGMTRTEQIHLRHRMALGSRGRRMTGQHRLVRVIEGWLTSTEFQDRQGRPLPLSLNGKGPNFRQLARAFGGDVPAVSIVAELKQHGLIRECGAEFYAPTTTHRGRALEGARQLETFMRRESPGLIEKLRLQKPQG
jgi:hypothetical protein